MPKAKWCVAVIEPEWLDSVLENPKQRFAPKDAPVDESDEDKPGLILDYDKDGNVVGLEILDASKRMANPMSVEYAIAR